MNAGDLVDGLAARVHIGPSQTSPGFRVTASTRSRKPGISKVQDDDDVNKLIWDPRQATYRDISYRFECFYQVPKGGVKTWSLGDL